MTEIMDKFFINIGFDAKEIRGTQIRGPLYIGLLYFLGFTTAILIMELVG